MSHLHQWSIEKIKQFESMSGQALLRDEQTLVSFSQDFGKLIQSQPSAVCTPNSLDALQSLVLFANQNNLPLTIRGNGMSQSGQSLAVPGGLTLCMQHFAKILEIANETIWVEANASWASLLELSLTHNLAPYVLPYNCNLSVAGVISAGGVGSSSFKYGSINSYVQALEVVDGLGELHMIDEESPLFHACLSGQGRFAVITKVCMRLRKVASHVRTFSLVYADQEQWFADIAKLKNKAHYMELFCSPSLQGSKLEHGKRVPIAQWLYALQCSVECSGKVPELNDLSPDLNPWSVINTQEEPIDSYFLRHNSRFEVMKMLGQWDLPHPWYECFVPTQVLQDSLDQLLKDLPLHYATLVHVTPMANVKANYLMFPDSDSVSSIMILHPGVPHPLTASCLEAIKILDARLLSLGGKRYLSGFLGHDLAENYWMMHYGTSYDALLDLKKEYDPAGIFSSMLYPD